MTHSHLILLVEIVDTNGVPVVLNANKILLNLLL